MQKLSEKKRIRKEKKCLISNSLRRGKEKKPYVISLLVQQKSSETLKRGINGRADPKSESKQTDYISNEFLLLSFKG